MNTTRALHFLACGIARKSATPSCLRFTRKRFRPESTDRRGQFSSREKARSTATFRQCEGVYIFIFYIYIIILLSGETRGWKVETSRLDRSSRGEIFAPRNYFRIFVFAKVIRKFGKTFEISNRSLHFNLENHLYFISRNNFCPISSHS